MEYSKNKMQYRDKDPKKFFLGSRLPQYIAAAAVTVGGFSMGNVMGWSSPALPDLRKSDEFLEMTSSEQSWIGSLMTAGAFIAALLAGVFVERFGRKAAMLGSSVFFMAGWVFISLADTVYMLYAGRFLTGIGVGTISLVAPVFLTEISESQIRGTIGVAFQLMVVLGMLFSSTVGYLTNWKWLSYASGVVPVIFALSITLLPESPRFLTRKGKPLEARRALCWLRASDPDNPSTSVLEELDMIQESVDTSTVTGFTLKSLFSPSIFHPILITLSLILFNQICGVSAVNFYTVQIFEHAETGLNSYLSTIVVGIVQVLSVFLASALVDRAGRRVLLLSSFVLMHISLVALGVFFHVKKSDDFATHLEQYPVLGCLPLGSVILFNIGYCSGIGSLVWTIMSEILPSNIIGPVYALETAYNWILAFLVTKFFALLNEALEIQNTFWLFGTCCVGAAIFTFFWVPETKGKTLEEIQEEYFKAPERNKPRTDSTVELVTA